MLLILVLVMVLLNLNYGVVIEMVLMDFHNVKNLDGENMDCKDYGEFLDVDICLVCSDGVMVGLLVCCL